MAEKITKKYAFAATGVLSITEDDFIIGVEDKGEYSLRKALMDFNNKTVKITVAYDEDYEEQDSDNKKVDTATGEILDI